MEIEITSSEESQIYKDKWYKKGDDLAKISKDDRLKGFLIVDVKEDGEFSEITFGDKGKLRINESYKFVTEKGQTADTQNRQEAQTIYPVFNSTL